MKYLLKVTLLLFIFFSFAFILQSQKKPLVIISTDIGGDDPDDYQSMVHLLHYADKFEIMGLISSPPKKGRKEHILEVLEAYEEDFAVLKKHSTDFPLPEALKKIVFQGALDAQKREIPAQTSSGAQHIIKVLSQSKDPVWVLVWGSITDVAQAVHTSPRIKKNLRVYSIGSWNTRHDSLARNYLYNEHKDLWWIESNTTFRGMYVGGNQKANMDNQSFVSTYLKDHGALGQLFYEKKADIKMGDTPSVLYLLHGDRNDPEGESWGGTYRKTGHGPYYWTDIIEEGLMEKQYDGAKTVNKYRNEFLNDWAKRMAWFID